MRVMEISFCIVFIVPPSFLLIISQFFVMSRGYFLLIIQEYHVQQAHPNKMPNPNVIKLMSVEFIVVCGKGVSFLSLVIVGVVFGTIVVDGIVIVGDGLVIVGDGFGVWIFVGVGG